MKFKDTLKLAFMFFLFVVTIPYEVSTNERTFSQLKLVKNYLRTTMSDVRLDNLILSRSESSVANDVHLEKMGDIKKQAN